MAEVILTVGWASFGLWGSDYLGLISCLRFGDDASHEASLEHSPAKHPGNWEMHAAACLPYTAALTQHLARERRFVAVFEQLH